MHETGYNLLFPELHGLESKESIGTFFHLRFMGYLREVDPRQNLATNNPCKEERLWEFCTCHIYEALTGSVLQTSVPSLNICNFRAWMAALFSWAFLFLMHPISDLPLVRAHIPIYRTTILDMHQKMPPVLPLAPGFEVKSKKEVGKFKPISQSFSLLVRNN